MSKRKYTSRLILNGRDNGKSFCFIEADIQLWVIPYRAAEDMENPPRGMFLRGPQLGEWGGNFVVPFGANIQHHLDRFWMETELHRGDIWLTSAEILDGFVDVAFCGSGDLISIELETELKEMLEPHGMW